MKPARDTLFNFILLFFYCGFIAFVLSRHELWGDEIHSWNIVKGSHTFSELFQNIKYEGHPPFWYLYLFCFTSFSHSLACLKIAHFVFVLLTASLLLFASPFTRLEKVLILCGYYFSFEYGILARNYMPAVFFAACAIVVFQSSSRYRIPVYYVLLVLTSNVHLLGLLLAASVHVGFCYDVFLKKGKTKRHIIAGILVLLPALYFILPPSDSQLNIQFWMDQWEISRLYSFAAACVRSMFPLTDFSNPHWWNTNFFLAKKDMLSQSLAIFIFATLLFSMLTALRKNKTAMLVLCSNLLLTFLFSLVFPLTSSRYAGFIFTGFILSAWIANRVSEDQFRKNIFIFFLILQLPAGIYAVAQESEKKFSCSSSVVEMKKLIPRPALVTSDYWCLNNLSAFLDTSVFCIELDTSASYLIWNSKLKSVVNYNYPAQLQQLFERNNRRPFYFFSSHYLGELQLKQGNENQMEVMLISECTEAIVASSAVYLYCVKNKTDPDLKM